MTRPDELLLTDQDGDTVGVREVFGFGGPALVLNVIQEGDYSGVNLSLANAVLLRNYLNDFIGRNGEK